MNEQSNISRLVQPRSLSADEPAKHQVLLHLFHQLALGSTREQDLEQAGPDQPLRCNRRAAEIGIERDKLAVEARENIVDHLPDLAQRMSGGNAILKIDIAEQRPARFICPAHLERNHSDAEEESCYQIFVQKGLFQQTVSQKGAHSRVRWFLAAMTPTSILLPFPGDCADGAISARSITDREGLDKCSSCNIAVFPLQRPAP